MNRRGFLAMSVGAICAGRVPGARADAPLPGDSLYQLAMPLALQDGSATTFAALRGNPTVISMFYASCDGVCPMIAFSMRRMEKALNETQRKRVQWVMVSFDPARDTPAALRTFASDNKLELPRWKLARPAEADARSLAAALDIRYRKLPSGMFSHSPDVVLLDADGVIRARTQNLTALDAEFMKALADQAGEGS
jgi:protein SCO1/2